MGLSNLSTFKKANVVRILNASTSDGGCFVILIRSFSRIKSIRVFLKFLFVLLHNYIYRLRNNIHNYSQVIFTSIFIDYAIINFIANHK